MAALAMDGQPLAGSRAVWFFVAVGVVLRLVRYALNSPLWWNEAFVAVNLLKRGYGDLLRPLDYGQVCPFAFLWVEKALTDTLGFTESMLRLYPLLCSVASLFLFAHVAGRFTSCSSKEPPVPAGRRWFWEGEAPAEPRGKPGGLAGASPSWKPPPDRARGSLGAHSGTACWLALAVLAVAYHPIRLGSEVKPYASDLLASLLLTSLALDWLADRSRTARLWLLAVIGPVAVTFSHPAAFVVGGVTLGLAPAVWRSGRGSARLALAAFILMSLTTFVILYLLSTGAQSASVLPAMREYWSEAFPPIDRPLALPAWLIVTHTGRFLAYPCGGDAGASFVPLLLLVVGIVATWRAGQRLRLAVLLFPFAFMFLAAALRRHPYGGHPRITQHLAPAICLLIGAGMAAILESIRNVRRQSRCRQLAALALLAIGFLPLGHDILRPYRSTIERDARAFARRFWPEQARVADVFCLRWDLGLAAWESPDLDTALYLCNQRIYSPSRTDPPPSHPPGSRPLHFILYHSPRDPGPDLSPWLASMQRFFRLTRCSEQTLPGPRGPRSGVMVFEFRTREPAPVVTRRAALSYRPRPKDLARTDVE